MRAVLFVLIAVGLLASAISCIQVPKPAKWLRRDKAQPDEVHSFRVALKQRNLDVLEKIMLDVSNPSSVNYGNHLTIDKILDIVAPTPEVEQQIVDFFTKNGAVNVESHRDVLVIRAAVKDVEKLFGAQLHHYVREDKENVMIVRSSNGYTLPEAIRTHVDFVSGIVDFPIAKRKKPARGDASPSSTVDPGNVIPQTLQKLYDLPSEVKLNPKSSLCLAEFQSDASFNYGDLSQFIQQTQCHNFNVTHVVGPFSPDSPDGESSLDVQYGGAVALGTDVWFWTVTGWMYEFATDLFNAKEAPLVVSMSWGWPEPWQCAGDNAPGNCNGISSLEYVNRVNAEFLKIGARGISLLASSGDQGAPGDENPSCDNTDTPISTIFPGASPYVTSVGATMLGKAAKTAVEAKPPVCQQFQCSTSTSELVCSYPDALITTGGGFSDYIPRPDWQAKEVASYLKSGVELPAAKYFNQTNRAFPDVAALGHNFLVVIGGSFEPVDGTSCSSPVMAGIISLLNSERLNSNKSPLGFLNPMLYKAAQADPQIYRDIPTGNNKCTEYCCNDVGYNAAKGWDPVTGLGTPKYPALLKYVQTLP